MSSTTEIIHQPSIIEHSHHNGGGGHQHGIDMEHPILALSVAVVSISVKEGYPSCFQFSYSHLVTLFVSY